MKMNYITKYSLIALLALTPIQIFALDTDNDGIENAIDLDDDNDGVLELIY